MSSVEAFGGSRVIATDGMIGRVADVLFDEEKWTVRYLVVNAGDWLPRRQVLVSPHAVRFIDAGSRLVVAGLTRRQVAGSPHMDTRSQITRQQEWEYCAYFGYSAYWPLTVRAAADAGLRSYRVLNGFLVRGVAEQLGRVDDVLFNVGTWVIQHIVIAAGRWLDCRRFEIAPERLRSVSWNDRCVLLDVKRADIRRSGDWRQTASRGS
jgi:sporulation protein YlmC with PRC-barrel domain